MKKMNQILRTGIITSMFLFACKIVAIAQETSSTTSTVTVENTTEPSSWVQENWMWLVAAGVVVLIIAVLAGSSKSKTTTVSHDAGGNVNRVTTTEVDG